MGRPDRISVPLDTCPIVVACGLGEHGLRGEESYLLPDLWCLHLYFYGVAIQVAGRDHAITPGVITLIPPGTRIVYRFARKRHRHFYVHFKLRKKGRLISMPLLQHLPGARDEILDRLQNMQRVLVHRRTHGNILLWALLWDLVEAGAAERQPGSRPSYLDRLDAFIEAHLPEKISVCSMAQHLGLSATHLNRLVKARHGVTTIQLMRRRRLQRVHHLLSHSTMPVAWVGAECGIGDLQKLNKAVRREYGKSPRQLRASGPGPDDATWTSERA